MQFYLGMPVKHSYVFLYYIKIYKQTKMKLQINGKTVELKYTFRSLMIYEKITDKSFNPENLTDVIIYMYSIILASDPNTDITWDEFLDFLDNNPKEFEEFSVWISNIALKNASISKVDEIEKTEVDPKKE